MTKHRNWESGVSDQGAFITPFYPPYLNGEIQEGIATGFALATTSSDCHVWLRQRRNDEKEVVTRVVKEYEGFTTRLALRYTLSQVFPRLR